MKIEDLRTEKNGTRVAATVTWEDYNRPVHDVFFETDEAFVGSLSCNPHSFLIACIVPAMHYGERRVFIDAEICPQLRVGLINALSWLRHWYYKPEKEIVKIEAKTRGTPIPRTPDKAGFFFSGGIDSFATLLSNRLNFPLEHPWSIKDGLLVYGLEIDETAAFSYVLNSLTAAADKAGITLIPVYTNIYLTFRKEDENNHFHFWSYEFQAAALSAVAHAFARRLTLVSIPSTFDIPNVTTKDGRLRPYGTHPLLDHNYSSSDLQILYDSITLSRFEKTKLIGEWDLALQNLRVCNQYKKYKPDMLNCGYCEKCIRTMLSLLSLDLLDKTRAFHCRDVSEDMVLKIESIPGQYAEMCYKECLFYLKEKGRNDLAYAIRRLISKDERVRKVKNWRKRLKAFDAKYFGGKLAEFRKIAFH